MKPILVFLILLTTVHRACAQDRASTYAPDSSAFSILFDSLRLDSAHSRVEIDLAGKWVYRKKGDVMVHVRGQLGDRVAPSTVPDSVAVTLHVFGKRYRRMLHTATADDLLFRRPRGQVVRRPRIVVRWDRRVSKRYTFYIDSVDMAAQ